MYPIGSYDSRTTQNTGKSLHEFTAKFTQSLPKSRVLLYVPSDNISRPSDNRNIISLITFKAKSSYLP